MAWIRFKRRCPKCGAGAFRRVRRKRWMRISGKLKYYSCDKCDTRFICWNKRISVRWGEETG